jgi:glycosyltransferase involved in cell wall biosynthesis
MKKKILFFCTFPSKERGFTGANIGNKVTSELLKQDFDIEIIDTGASVFNPHDANWQQRFRYNFHVLGSYVKKLFKLRKTLKNDNFDYLYFLPASSAKGHFRDVITVMFARSYVKQIIAHNRNGNFYQIYDRKWHRMLTNYFVKSVNKFVFLSENLKKTTHKFLTNDKTCVAFNPIDDAVLCSESAVIEKINQRKGREHLKVLFLSNMIPSKGYFDLIKAAAVLKRDGFQNYQMDFIGRWNNEADKQEVTDYLKANQIEGHVVLHGKITDRGRIREMLLEADMFILPTYYPVEAQPRSIIEAINAGTPIVATRHASIPEMLTDGVEGFLVEKKNPESIANAIKKFDDIEQWKKMAFASRDRFNKKFSKEAVREQLLKAF